MLKRSSLLLSVGVLFCLSGNAEPGICTYSTYKWNALLRKPVEFEEVTKSYSELSSSEIDSLSGCSVCDQDQVEIRLPNIQPFRVCNVIAGQIEKILFDAIDSGYVIDEIVGYRNGKTRGPIDTKGNRTQFSNHSFGIAIDINPDDNGLYDQCIEWGPECRLIRGGEWTPGTDPKSLTKESYLVVELKKAGLLWGGEIAGRQKDFMHFSPSGY